MKIAIIGAGAAGLSAAYDLAGAGHAVTVYEAAPNVGGLASGFKEPHWDWTIERFYHHWFQTDKAVLGLIDEIGAKDRVRFVDTVTAVYDRGQFFAFDSMAAQLKFPGLSLFDKLRAGPAGLYLRLTKNWKALEKTTAHEWLSRWTGKGAYHKLAEPMLVGKFGEEYYRDVNMAWFWARVHSRTKFLGTFVGGFQAFFDALADAVRARGVAIELSAAVRSIAPRVGGGLTVQAPSGPIDYDLCLATTSPRLMERLTPALPDAYLGQLRGLKSMGAVVLILTLDRQLNESGIYWHNLPKGEGFPFLALCEHTNFMSPEHFGGDRIVYCGDYLVPEHEYFRLSHEEILERFLPALSRFNPNFDRSWVKKTWLFRETYAQPVPPLNHSRNIPDIRTPIPGLYFASMSQVYPWDRGTNYAVEIGRRTAKMMMGDQ
ncbi:MAG: NAD(P)/FAD-dependent oxidoreductase [Deltaproteobacteria bacterium]|nr:NAD(P)/FAD-dependent oxidoreductase [Deltaproteobacteria bacterium]MBI3388968.1 NAD(P)/FAD-dependent oxidoreductase [Deltaproteobacteria bacterium]